METESMVNTLKKKRFNYGYVIIGLSFLALFVTMGIRGSFGTYLTAWEETFSVGRLSVSFVSFVSLLVYGSSMVAAGKLADRIGTRKVLSLSMLILGVCLSASFFATNIWHMVIIYGIFGSIGFGFGSNVTVSVAIVKWFKEKKGLAVSFVVLGMAAGPMIYSPINLIVIDNIGWQWLFLIYGSIYTFLFLPLFLIFFIDSPNDKKNKNNKKTSKTIPKRTSINIRQNKTIFSIFKYPVTWLIIISYFICGFTDIGLIQSHLVPMGESRGYSNYLLANAIFLYGVVNITGTLVAGYFSDKLSNKKILMVLFVIRIISLIILISFDQQSCLLVFALLYGLTDIASIAPFTIICSQIFGANQMGSAFGLISFFHQFGAAMGSIIPGYLYGLSLSYMSTLILCIVLLIIGLIFLFFINEKRKISI